MTFQQPVFFVFFLIIFVSYFFIHPSRRWIVLLVGSLFFYASLGVYYLFIPLGLVIGSSYLIGRRIEGEPDSIKQKFYWVGVGIQVIVLLFFRLYPHVVEFFVRKDLIVTGEIPDLLSAIGVSFYVFQAIGYLTDIYLGKIKSEPNLGIYALFICFFPRIIQGPIERGKDLLPQLQIAHGFDPQQARLGAMRFMQGLFKKLVIADRLALIVDPIYAGVSEYSGLFLWGATIAYAFQLYFDFSGYTDMALGIAQIFNLRLSENFKSPYLADSITEFWRRWHITFSRWIMDYLFKPMQLSFRKMGKSGTVLALMITFALSGLWHGVTGGYLIWGLLHGFFLSIAFIWSPVEHKLAGNLRWMQSKGYFTMKVVFTFSLVCLSWIFFRAETVSDALIVLSKGLPWNWLTPSDVVCGKLAVRSIISTTMDGGGVLNEACIPLRSQITSISDGIFGINGSVFGFGLLLAFIFGFVWQPKSILSKHWYWRWSFYFGLACFILLSVVVMPTPVTDAVPYLYLNY